MSGAAPSAPPRRARRLRIATVQFDPRLGHVPANAAKVQAMTQTLEQGDVDLLVLPEMALTGYMFKDPEAIRPYLEQQGDGPTSRLCAQLARRLRCHVIAGYPEALPEGAPEGPDVGYNSAAIAAPDGSIVGNYRKTFLFETDKVWSREGDGFKYFDLEGVGRVVVAICMDMNPKDFVSPWNDFELATYTASVGADLLVVPMNWLDPEENLSHDSDSESDEADIAHKDFMREPSASNLNYWAARLTPLHHREPEAEKTAAPSKEVVFIAANRCGTEEGTTFVGTSAVMRVSAQPAMVQLVAFCNRAEERVLVCNIE